MTLIDTVIDVMDSALENERDATGTHHLVLHPQQYRELMLNVNHLAVFSDGRGMPTFMGFRIITKTTGTLPRIDPIDEYGQSYFGTGLRGAIKEAIAEHERVEHVRKQAAAGAPTIRIPILKRLSCLLPDTTEVIADIEVRTFLKK